MHDPCTDMCVVVVSAGLSPKHVSTTKHLRTQVSSACISMGFIDVITDAAKSVGQGIEDIGQGIGRKRQYSILPPPLPMHCNV